jgi:hypothetical protein
MQKYLYKLTPEEKGYLMPYIETEKNTVNVGLDDRIMGGLVAKGITYRASSTGNMVTGFAYNLQPWAREYLMTNPQLHSGASGRPMAPGERYNFKS